MTTPSVVWANSRPPVDIPACTSGADRVIRVLMIEDNPEQAEWNLIALENSEEPRFELSWVSSLVEGMMTIRLSQIDVILLDLGLPELEGYRSHTAIRAAAPLVPVVVLTEDMRKESRRLALSGGARSYLLKSATSAEDLRRELWRAATERW
ncbi:MAG: response regulator [Bryobacterales bacterium]|nr:response regulator [Bryobacterales bacterium]